MPSVTKDQILKALGKVKDPESGDDIVNRDMISGLQTKDGHVAFAIEVDPARGAELEPLRKEAEKTVHDLPGVISVTAVLTAEVPAGPGSGGNGGQPHGQPTQPGMPVGDSMEAPVRPSFAEGDLAVFSGEPLRSRDFALVRRRSPVEGDGEVTFRQVFFDPGGKVRLQPLNLNYTAEVYPKKQVLGMWKLVAHLASF